MICMYYLSINIQSPKLKWSSMIIPKKSPTLRSTRTSICAASVHLESGQQVKKAQAHHTLGNPSVGQQRKRGISNQFEFKVCHYSIRYESYDMVLQCKDLHLRSRSNKTSQPLFGNGKKLVGRIHEIPWNPSQFQTDFESLMISASYCQLTMDLTWLPGQIRNFSGFSLIEKIQHPNHHIFFNQLETYNLDRCFRKELSNYVRSCRVRKLSSWICFERKHDMGVSKNRGTPTWMVYNGKPYWNGWFGSTTICGNIQMHLGYLPW